MAAKACGAALCAALILAAASAAARSFTVDDLLAQTQLGAAVLDPQGRWAVLERQGPYDQGTRFDLGQANVLSASRLLIARVDGAGPARPWLSPDPGPGQVFGGFSPSGARAAVYQLHAGGWRLGVVTTATGATRWLPVRPAALWFGRTLAWLDDRELLVLARTAPGLPERLADPSRSAARLPGLWARAARGAPAVTVVGSGRYLGLRPRPRRRLLRIDVVTGAVRTVADGEITDFEVAPGGRTVALREAGADLQGRLGRPMHGAWGVAPQAERLALVDLATGRRVDPCPGGDVLGSLLAWSPDGGALLVYVRAPDAPWTAGAFWRVSASGAAARLTPSGFQAEITWRPERVQAGWMGADPVVLGRAGPGAPPAWFQLGADGPAPLGRGLPAPGRVVAADAAGLTVIAAGRLWRIGRTGRARPIGPTAPVRPLRTFSGRDGRVARAWPARGWALAAASDGVTVLALDGATVRPAARTRAGREVLAAAAGAILTSKGGPGGRRDVGLARGAGPGRPLATLNAGLADVDPLDVRPVEHLGPDGRPLRSWLFLPVRRPGAPPPPPPLVVKVYSGDVYPLWPRPRPPVRGFIADVRVLVGHGYAVLVPSLPLPDRTPQEPAAGLAERILAVVDAAAHAPGLAGTFDPRRLALVGQSYGAYTVAAVLTQTDRFCAAVAQSGYYDLAFEWASLSATQRTAPDAGLRSNAATGNLESGQGRMGVPLWADPARYARNSPLLAADRITTPVLLIHGDQDGNVPLRQSEALFSALYRQGKDAVLATYWGEGHNIASPGNVRDLYQRMFAFLDAGFSGRRAGPAGCRGPGSASSAPRPPSPPP